MLVTYFYELLGVEVAVLVINSPTFLSLSLISWFKYLINNLELLQIMNQITIVSLVDH